LRAKTALESGLSRVEIVLLDDGPGNDPGLFQLAVAHLEDLVSEAPPVLVQCHAGRSRSAIVVAGYFVKTLGLEPTDALKLVGDKREIAVTPGLESLLDSL
jgi:protein-tyrosine phosphatase